MISPAPSLGELRALRDSYRAPAIRALEKRWRKPMGAFIDECAQFPLKHAAAIEVLAESITDMTDWAALTRFIWLADLVWEAESEALESSPYYRYGKAKSRAA